MMTPLICAYLLAMLAATFRSFFHIPWTAAVFIYIYLVFVSCRLFKEYKKDARNYDERDSNEDKTKKLTEGDAEGGRIEKVAEEQV
jgi:ABC-type transport system involved in cytochrome bd biosynthesis fused ATPase/permease subunit